MPIDLSNTLRDLYAEKERIERVIASLESLQNGTVGSDLPEKGRRGRKSMGPEERLEVSERMRKYWAGRRDDVRKAAG